MKPFFALVGGFVVSLGMFVGGAVLAAVILKADPVERPDTSVDVARLWTAQPRPVDVEAQDLERLPALNQPAATEESASAAAAAPRDADTAADPGIDPATTASVANRQDSVVADDETARPTAASARGAEIVAAHVAWCSSRYRSYSIDDNSYRPYSGGRRECVSPYLEEAYAAVAAGAELPGNDGSETLAEVGDGGAAAGAHADMEAMLRDDGAESDAPLLQYASDEPEADRVSLSHVRDCMARYRSYDPRDNSYQPYGGGPRRQCE